MLQLPRSSETDCHAEPASFAATYDKASLPLTSSFTAFGLPQATVTNTFAKTGQWQKTSTADSQEWSFTFGTDGTFRRAASPLSSRGLLYNTALQLDRVRLATTSGLFTADEAITYDGYGRVAGSVLSATGDALDASQAFTYDAAGRLETWTLDGATTTYTNDAAGNLTGIDRPGTGDDTTFTPGDDNQLASAVTAGVITTYAYDDFGRRTHESSSAGETDYTWDSLGRLTGIESEDATSTYEYGPTGMRERITVVSAEATTTTECVWSGGTLVASRVSETQSGTTTVTDYRYLYGPDSLPLELIVTPLGGTPSAYTYQCDRSGSVVALTDATGAAVATYTYDPWGEVLEAPTTGVGARNPLRYRGYYFDDATGLYYLPARYYDPEAARFLSPDPAAPSAGDPLSLNRYAYCVGDPVNADDPTGAIMDSDGNGKLDNYDHNLASAKVSSWVMVKKYYRARANAEYSLSIGAFDDMEVYIDEMNDSHIGPDPRYSESLYGSWAFFSRGYVMNGVDFGASDTITSAHPTFSFTGGPSVGITHTRGRGYTVPGLYLQGSAVLSAYGVSGQWKPGQPLVFQRAEAFGGSLGGGLTLVLETDYSHGWTLPDGTDWGYPW